MRNNRRIIPGIRSHPLNRLRAQRGVVETEILAVAAVACGGMFVTAQIDWEIRCVDLDTAFDVVVFVRIEGVVERKNTLNFAVERSSKTVISTDKCFHDGVR